MLRHAPKIAAFAIASVALGALLALTIPTELRTAPNSKLEQLSEPKIVEFPGAGHVVTGQDSYPVTYSPQFVAVTDQAERARLARLKQPGLAELGDGQPDAASERADLSEAPGDVTVQRGSARSADAAAHEEPAQLVADSTPQG